MIYQASQGSKDQVRGERVKIEGIQVVLGLQRKFFVQFVLVPHNITFIEKGEDEGGGGGGEKA